MVGVLIRIVNPLGSKRPIQINNISTKRHNPHLTPRRPALGTRMSRLAAAVDGSVVVACRDYGSAA